ncbi:hypothetical protein EJB05_20769 [Eragrostis curvula]|uniref:Serine/threonine-protein phosphatase 2A 55 kDa regulatory subunit B n=1 Tax=Eragrostis curvula TaxID=38414 RepID=A0A5J9V1F1_9POAL|nr:hypothetical protein EJB05_20769 [Eragrostis curvula]
MMSNNGRRRRNTRSIAPSPSSSPRSGFRVQRAAQLPQWKLAQVLGDLPPAARDQHNAVLDDDADEISALEFDGRGEHLAPVTTPAVSSSSEGPTRTMRGLEPSWRARTTPVHRRRGTATRRSSRATSWSSTRCIAWNLREDQEAEVVRAALTARCSCSPRMTGQIKLWKLQGRFPNTSRRKGRMISRDVSTPSSYSDPFHRSRKGGDRDDSGDGYSAKCRRVFSRAHQYNINSISNNCDGETFVSADDCADQPVEPGGDEPVLQHRRHEAADMEDLVEVITAAEFHPSSGSTLAYGSSRGLVRLVDLRRSALCDGSARTFKDRENRIQPKTFFTEIISCITDLKFTGEGKYLLTRDYLNLKLWDLRMESCPVVTYKVHEFLRPKLSELYTDDYIFNRFSCCASNDGSYFATGSYSNTFKVFSRAATDTSGTTLEASTNPYKHAASTQAYRPSKGPGLLSNFASRNNRKGWESAGQDGLRSVGNKEETPCNMASKVTHMAWHPTENFIVCAANNSLYMYHT